MRLGCDLAGRSSELLRQARLSVRGGMLALTGPESIRAVLEGEQTRKRAHALAERLKLGFVVDVTDAVADEPPPPRGLHFGARLFR
jgi:hypothetical protein